MQNPDGATISYLPGNAVCVQGFASGTKNILAQYVPAVQIMEGTCTNPKYYFNPGDPVCAHISGSGSTPPAQWHVAISGGSNNQCYNYPTLPNVNFATESANIVFILPTNNAAIPGSCTSNNTTDIRGLWTVTLQDNLNNGRGSESFKVKDAFAFANLNTQQNGPTDLSGQSGFPPTGIAKYPISVGNNGPDAAPNAQLVVSVPASTVFQSFTQTSGVPFNCTGPSGGNITCTRTVFDPDTYASFALQVSYSGQVNNATLNSTSTITSGATEVYAGDNSATGTALITTNANVGQFTCRPDITLPSLDATGRNVTYTFFTSPPAYSTYFTVSAAYTGNYFAPVPASGTKFPIGNTFIALNSIQGSGFCGINIKITDGQRPDLTVTASHASDFVRGSSGVVMNVSVSNVGGISTTGAVTVKDQIPPGLVPTSFSGTGWTCNLSTQSCARADALAAGGTYPPITITANLARYIPISGPFTNHVTVSGGGQSITDNDSFDDNLSIVNATLKPKSDYNADARSDVIWRKSTTGENAMWLMFGVTISSPVLLTTVADTNWKMAGVGDFNGDGKTDVIWQHYVTGQVVLWLMNGSVISSTATVTTVADTNWKIAGVGDFNNDGKSDMFWRNSATGDTAVYLMNGSAIIGGGGLATVSDLNYTPVGFGDFNADGNTDILWREGVTGANVVWLMSSGGISTAIATNSVPNVSYKVVGVGDADGDGKADVFWWNQATGDVVVWMMNGYTLSSSGFITTVSDVNWHVEAVGDFNGDGKSDLMWRKVTTGEVVAWIMNGTALKQASAVTTVSDLNWSMVAPK